LFYAVPNYIGIELNGISLAHVVIMNAMRQYISGMLEVLV